MQTALSQDLPASERYPSETAWQTATNYLAVNVDHDLEHSSPVLSPLTPPPSVQVHQRSDEQLLEPHHRSEPSFPDAHPALPDQDGSTRWSLTLIISAYKRRYQQMLDVRSRCSSHMLELQYQWTNCQHSLKYLQSSTNQARRSPKNRKRVTPASRRAARTIENYEQVQEDVDTLAQRMQHVTTLMDQTKGHDRLLERATRAFDNAALAMFTALRGNEVMVDDDDDDAVLPDVSLKASSECNSIDPPSSFSTAPVIPQLDRYYDAVGNFKIMRERLSDVYIERQEQWERRAIMADQEQVAEQSDEDFIAEWRQMLDAAEEDLRVAGEVVEDARKACDADNIDIPMWAQMSLSATGPEQLAWDSTQAVSPPNSNPAKSAVIRHLHPGMAATSVASGNLLAPIVSPMRTPPPNDSLATEKILHWRQEVADRNHTLNEVSGTILDNRSIDDSELCSSNFRSAAHPRRARSLQLPSSSQSRSKLPALSSHSRPSSPAIKFDDSFQARFILVEERHPSVLDDNVAYHDNG